MPTQFLDPRVYGRTGLREFTEALQPGLQQAMNFMLQRKIMERQQQEAMQRMQDVLGPEAVREITPMEQYQKAAEAQGMQVDVDFDKLRYIAPEKAYKKIFQKLGAKPPKIKKQFAIERGKIPPGVKIAIGESGLPVLSYEAPSTNLFQFLSVDEQGKPVLNLGGRQIPLRGISAKGVTFPTSANYLQQAKESIVTKINAGIPLTEGEKTLKAMLFPQGATFNLGGLEQDIAGLLQGRERPKEASRQLEEEFDIGAIYENAQGEQKRYLGGGKWGNP